MYWVSIMHYNRNASVFRTGDPIQLTIGNPAYFPRCLFSLESLRARAAAPSADPSSKHARSTLGRLCRCRSRKFKLLHKQQTTVELELELELGAEPGAERGRRATSLFCGGFSAVAFISLRLFTCRL